MKSQALFGMTIGILVILSSFAHAFLGWPAMHDVLQTTNTNSDLIGAMSVGWHFGSVAMFTFGCIILFTAVEVWQEKNVQRGYIFIISLAYLLFGSVVFVVRNYNTHFLLFVITGVLTGLFALRIKRR